MSHTALHQTERSLPPFPFDEEVAAELLATKKERQPRTGTMPVTANTSPDIALAFQKAAAERGVSRSWLAEILIRAFLRATTPDEPKGEGFDPEDHTADGLALVERRT